LRSRQRVEDALRASEAKFSGILGIAADAIITVDGSQRIVHFNRGAEQIFGYKAADAIGRHLNILIPARYRVGHEAHMQRFAQAPETSRQMGERREIFGLRSDGAEFPAEASISKLVERDGILFTVVLRDITERVRSAENERFLASAGGTLAQSLDFNEAARAIADLPVPRLADACIVDLIGPNETMRRVASTRQREQLTSALQSIAAHPLDWDSPSPIVDAIRRRRRELATSIDAEWFEANEEPSLVGAWRELGVHSLMAMPLVRGDEVFGAMTLILVDPNRSFTADHRALADKYATVASTTLENARLYGLAQSANQARDEVLGIVSHDLRNPISAIGMCARVLEENAPENPSERAALLGTIRESATWANRLIQDLLDVANIERGQLSLQTRAEDPAQIVLQALHMFEVEAEQHGIKLDAQLATNLPLVEADGARGQFRQRVEQSPARQPDPRARVFEHEGEPLPLLPRVERDVGAARLEHTEQPDDHRRRTLHAEPDGHVRPDAHAPQVMGQTVGPLVQLAEAQTVFARDDGRGLRRALGLRLEELVQA